MIRQPSTHCTVELQALPARIRHVRRIVSAQLRYWHLDPLIDPAMLGVTELLANVHRHARPSKQCTLELCALLDQLTISVHDLDPTLPRIRTVDTWETSGRGLSLIAALSQSWGVRPNGTGKVVWFTLPVLVPALDEARQVPACWDTMPMEAARMTPGSRTRMRSASAG
ncbi:ATP-binding protein [Streptomyces halobius]|uniref:ATP-binding protein n=1 Tax=Streptomyces halobius TaxID=2879846 RepID=A0ABY4MG14_9ACTN|nr:ATP-binding protein [Streptomyces halobius]UQA96725.1 ATP-binding protein [Streptomyces halobius]